MALGRSAREHGVARRRLRRGRFGEGTVLAFARDSHAGDFEQGGRNVDQPDFSGHAGGYALGGKMGFREFDQEWNVDGLIEEEDAVSFFAGLRLSPWPAATTTAVLASSFCWRKMVRSSPMAASSAAMAS